MAVDFILDSNNNYYFRNKHIAGHDITSLPDCC